MTWDAWAQRELNALHDANRLRRAIAFDADGPEGVREGQRVISFASNDYLGLAGHPSVRAAAHAAIDRFGTGATAARLVVGTRTLHEHLEAALATWKHTDSALVFPTGYAANMGVLTALGGEDVTIFSDALNHASIIDGCRLSRARTVIYRHGDREQLRALLAAHGGRKLVVTETVFSMDGDRIDVNVLAPLCAQHNALLVLDEAHDVFHSSEVFASGEVLRVGTLSKTLGALGGFVAGSRALIELLINRARMFVFTTALSPADTAAALRAVEIYTSAEGAELRAKLRRAVDRIWPGHPSAILPIVLGADTDALMASEQLLERGLLVPAIRPPTVPEGAARLRIALCASHTDAMLTQLQTALAELSLNFQARADAV